MKGFKSVFLSLIVYCGMLMGCSMTSSMAAQIQSQPHTFLHDGIKRTYSIYIPEGIEGYHPVPLLVALHGGGGSAKKWPAYTNNGFEHLADQEHFILVYPNGLEGHWNDGRDIQQFYCQREAIDDAGFLASLIDQLTNSYPIDADRIYVVGASNGGMMAHKLAAEYAEKVASIATVISSIPKNLAGRLHPTQPVSVLMINGTDDPLVRWEGGPVKLGRQTNGDVISTDQSIKFWTENNKCPPSGDTDTLPDTDPDDGTLVTRTSYSNCSSGSEVMLYKIIGGGHTWPSRQEKRGRIGKLLIDKIVGNRSRDIDACEVIWQFLKNHPKRHESRY